MLHYLINDARSKQILHKGWKVHGGWDDWKKKKNQFLPRARVNCATLRSPATNYLLIPTDTENIRFVFAAVKDTILQSNLKEYNLV
jgi:hypothetical protein